MLPPQPSPVVCLPGTTAARPSALPGAPDPKGSADDLTRWNIWTRLGFAVVASTYHQGVSPCARRPKMSSALGSASLRSPAGRSAPSCTVSRGGLAWRPARPSGFARATQGHLPYDAALLTNGVPGGATYSYDSRMDLRVV